MDLPYEDLYWTSTDGLRLYARDYRPAQEARLPVICVHGLTRNSADFDRFAPWVAERGRRVLAVDLRGRGRSERDPRPKRYNAATYANDVLALMRAQGIERAVFVGTSLGVWVTMTVAGKRPDAVAAAVLNDAGPEVGKVALARIGGYAGQAVPPMTREETAAYAQRVAGIAFPRYTADDWREMAARMFRERDDGLYERDYDPRVVRTAGPWLVRLLRPLLWHSFRRLARGRPTLLLRGALSDVLERELVERMVRAVPSLTVAEIPDVGHAPDLSEAAARAAVAAFLDTVP